MFSSVLYILLAIVVLLILITVHEFGHYTFGKLLGFKINEFSIGFGKHAIFQRTNKKGEKFSIRLIPLGGYCAFEGEDEDKPNNPDAFNNQKAWKRLIVVLGGVVFNFLFAIVTAVIFLMVSGYAVPQVYYAHEDNPYFQKGDIIYAVNGKSLEIYRHLTDEISNFKEGENYVVTIMRDGVKQDITVSNKKYDAFYYTSTPKDVIANVYKSDNTKMTEDEFVTLISSIVPIKNADGSYQKVVIPASTFFYKNADNNLVEYVSEDLVKLAGVTLAPAGVSIGFIYTSHAENYGFFEALLKAWPFVIYICKIILVALAGIFTGATGIRELGGTITAVGQMAEVAQMGFTQFLMLFPLLSVNLALFNVLPIPALDGARAVFILIEMIFRKPVPRNIEAYIHTIGLIILFALVIFLDVYHIFFM